MPPPPALSLSLSLSYGSLPPTPSLFLSLSLCPSSPYLSVSLCRALCRALSQYVSLSVSLTLSVCVWVCLSLSPSLSLDLCLFVCLSLSHLLPPPPPLSLSLFEFFFQRLWWVKSVSASVMTWMSSLSTEGKVVLCFQNNWLIRMTNWILKHVLFPASHWWLLDW